MGMLFTVWRKDMHDNLLRRTGFANVTRKVISLAEYLDAWQHEPSMQMNPAGRLVSQIGEPRVVHTAQDDRLRRIFGVRDIYYYEPFAELLGLEEPLHQLVQALKYAAHGLEPARQIIYLVGPVGSGKSTIVEILKRLMEKAPPMWVLAVKDENTSGRDAYLPSPVYEHPLGLFDAAQRVQLQERYHIADTHEHAQLSPWAAHWLAEFDGDLSRFFVMEVQPSIALRRGITRVEAGDSKNSNLSALIGREDDSGDPARYHYSGALNCAQGLVELFEMFKMPPAMFTPLISATQEHCYSGAGALGMLPCQSLLLAHSNEPEWEVFKEQPVNAAMVDRILPVQVPYCVRLTEECGLYRQQLERSDFRDVPIVPGALDLAARFAVATRVHPSSVHERIRVYNGRASEMLAQVSNGKREAEPLAEDFREAADWREGMGGVSTRTMLKVLPDLLTMDPTEPGLDPVLLLQGLNKLIVRKQIPLGGDDDRDLNGLLEEIIEDPVEDIVRHLLWRAFYEDYDGYVQKEVARYLAYAEAYGEEQAYKDPESGDIVSRSELDAHLSKLEQGMQLSNPKLFRAEAVKRLWRFQADEAQRGKPVWLVLDEATRRAFEGNLMPSDEEMIPLIHLEPRKEAKEQAKHDAFMDRLCKLGCTARQARRMIEWYINQG